jgi:hypothetical protein
MCLEKSLVCIKSIRDFKWGVVLGWVLGWVILLNSERGAHAAVVHRRTLLGPKIEGLKWSSDQLEIFNQKVKNRDRSYVLLEGEFNRPGFDLYAHHRIISVDSDGKFQFKVSFRSKPVQVSLKASNHRGVVETEEVLLLQYLHREPEPVRE